jgi:hypothetical protein
VKGKRTVAICVLLAVALVAGAIVALRGSATLSPAATAAQLRSREKTTYSFTCRRIHNDGSITLAGVNYRCDAAGGDLYSGVRESYFVATDSHRIKAVEPLG